MRRSVVALAGLALLVPAVPATAATASLSAFYAQPLAWGPCPDADAGADTGTGSVHADDATPVGGHNRWDDVECATVRVPRDYRHPDGAQESVGLSRRLATDQAHRLGVVIPVPGGPGGSGLADVIDDAYDGLAARYDVIGLDPRGVGTDDPLSCGADQANPGWSRPTEQQMREVVASARARERACEANAGDRLPYFTTANNARDLDVVRAALGEPKLNLMGQSYGTYVTAVYGTLFPDHLNRSVLDSAMNPDWLYWDAWKQQSVAQNKVVDLWMSWAAEHDATYGLGSTAAAVHATVEALYAKLRADPVEVDGIPYDGEAVDRVFFEVTEPGGWAEIADEITHLRAGSTTVRPRGADSGDQGGDGVWDATNCEVEWPHDVGVYYDAMRTFGRTYPYGWGAMNAIPQGCAFRTGKPVEPLVSVHRTGYPTGLVVQGELDAKTPYAGGQVMAGLLGDRLLTGVREGRHVSYGQNDCVTATVDAYFLDGTLPAAGASCPGGDPALPAAGE